MAADDAGGLDLPLWKEDFARLVRETTPRLFRMAARLLGEAAEAEDVLQECFMRSHDMLASGRLPTRLRFEAWLSRAVVNASIDALRSRRRRQARHERAQAGEILVEDGRLDGRAALNELATWLETLPPDQRAALVLKEVEGCSAAEVAMLMGCSEGAVEQRLVRARAALRERRSDDER